MFCCYLCNIEFYLIVCNAISSSVTGKLLYTLHCMSPRCLTFMLYHNQINCQWLTQMFLPIHLCKAYKLEGHYGQMVLIHVWCHRFHFVVSAFFNNFLSIVSFMIKVRFMHYCFKHSISGLLSNIHKIIWRLDLFLT